MNAQIQEPGASAPEHLARRFRDQTVTEGLARAYRCYEEALKESWEVKDRLTSAHEAWQAEIPAAYSFKTTWYLPDTKFDRTAFYGKRWKLRYKCKACSDGKYRVNALPDDPTWLDIWKVADALLRATGDAEGLCHHVCIDGIEHKPGSRLLTLRTGS